jgi:hypothetical protein
MRRRYLVVGGFALTLAVISCGPNDEENVLTQAAAIGGSSADGGSSPVPWTWGGDNCAGNCSIGCGQNIPHPNPACSYGSQAACEATYKMACQKHSQNLTGTGDCCYTCTLNSGGWFQYQTMDLGSVTASATHCALGCYPNAYQTEVSNQLGVACQARFNARKSNPSALLCPTHAWNVSMGPHICGTVTWSQSCPSDC